MTDKSQSRSDELLPCPRCQSDAWLRHNNESDYEQHWDFCVICGNEECGIEGKCFKSPSEASLWWNHRTRPAAGEEQRTRRMVDVLSSVIAKLHDKYQVRPVLPVDFWTELRAVVKEEMEWDKQFLVTSPMPSHSATVECEACKENEEYLAGLGFLIITRLGNMLGHPEWYEKEWPEWYKQEEWSNSHRAAESFIAKKFLSAPPSARETVGDEMGDRTLWNWATICEAAFERAKLTNRKAAENLRPAFRAIIEAGLNASSPPPALAGDAVPNELINKLAGELKGSGGDYYVWGNQAKKEVIADVLSTAQRMGFRLTRSE